MKDERKFKREDVISPKHYTNIKVVAKKKQVHFVYFFSHEVLSCRIYIRYILKTHYTCFIKPKYIHIFYHPPLQIPLRSIYLPLQVLISSTQCYKQKFFGLHRQLI